MKWSIVADARLSAKADIDIAQTHKKCRLGIIPTHFSLFFFIFEEVNTVLDCPQQPTNDLGRLYLEGV